MIGAHRSLSIDDASPILSFHRYETLSLSLSLSPPLSRHPREAAEHPRIANSLCPLPGVVRRGHLVRRHGKRRGARGRPLHRGGRTASSSVHRHGVCRRGGQGERGAGAPGAQRLGVREGLGVHVFFEGGEKEEETIEGMMPIFFFFSLIIFLIT